MFMQVRDIPLINHTERFVLTTMRDYHQYKVPQLLFRRWNATVNSTVKKAIKRLDDEGLIMKEYNLLDMRQKYLMLTDKGVELVAEITEKGFN